MSNENEATIIGALLDMKAQLNRIESLLTQQYPQIDPIPLGYQTQCQQNEKAK